jgi:hypothetical protein
MALSQDDDDNGVNLAAGPSGYYNPAMGLMMVQQPEAVAAHLASRGIEPPTEDYPEGFKVNDAHKSLGQHLAGEVPSTDWHEVGPARAFGNWLRGGGEAAGGVPMPQPRPLSAPPDPDRIDSAFRVTGYNTKLVPPEEDTDLPPGGIGVDVPMPPSRPSNAPASVKVSDLPTAGGEAGETLPARGEVTDGMNGGEVPMPRPRPPEAPQKAKEQKGGGLDDFGKALAGLAAMKTPPPQIIHSPAAPHPSTQLTRSNLPQVLLAQMQRSGSPGSILRLGEALRGR